MAKGVIQIEETRCMGYGFCEMFCKKGCIVTTSQRDFIKH
jgi:MinD superfamily P-loop ATPase